jgi:O-methyltransferase
VDDRAANLYLDLLKKCLTRYEFGEGYRPAREPETPWKRELFRRARTFLSDRGVQMMEPAPFDPALREIGRDWPPEAETMVGLRRLDNVQKCVVDVLRHGVPGDLIETGVWRGGTVIFMRAILAAFGDATRTVWAADSFQGLPKPSGRYPSDDADNLWRFDVLAVPEEQVRANFERYGLLDDQVRFLKGWFQDTLRGAPIDKIAVARLDGDMYESTIVALEALYPKLSPGGFLIVDDYGAVGTCKQAVDDYRRDHGITESIEQIDWTGAYWQRGG